MSFSIDLRKFAQKGPKALKRVRTQVLLKLFGAVVFDTPVDSGRLRGNWQTSINKQPVKKRRLRKPETVLREVKRELKESDIEDEVFFTNKLPYAGIVEFGDYPGVGPKTVRGAGGIFSSQSPQGMVRKNVIRFDRLFKQEAARERRR